MKIDPIKRALELRKTLKLEDRVLVADFSDTLQGKDTSQVIDLMPNIMTGELVFRTKVNVKPFDPIYVSKHNGTEFFDVAKKTNKEIEDFIKKHVFDFPLWFKHTKGFNIKKAGNYNLPFILQVAGCNFHDGSSTGGCWYCFVDDQSNDGKVSKGKTYLGINETIESMLSARAKIKKIYRKLGNDMHMKVLRISGGEPTIVLDWVLNTWREIAKRNLDFVGQIDSNLSTGVIVDDFEKQGIYEPKTLEKLAEFPIKVLTALKGVDKKNLQSNVQSTATMKIQEYSLKKFLQAGFDIYPQMYNPNPATLKRYLKRIDSKIENFSLRIHIGPLKMYGPNTKRLTLEAERKGMDPKTLIKEKKDEWDSNYKNGCEVLDLYLRKRYGIGYKETTRSDVLLKVKK